MAKIKDWTRKWLTMTTFVDIDTGEILGSTEVLKKKHYIIIKKTTSYENGQHYNIRTITNHCEKSKQISIW